MWRGGLETSAGHGSERSADGRPPLPVAEERTGRARKVDALGLEPLAWTAPARKAPRERAAKR